MDNKLQLLEDTIRSLESEMEYIESAEDIFRYINETTYLAKNTVRLRLEAFKKILHVSSVGCGNGMYQRLKENNSSLPIELLDVYELLYCYLCDKSHDYLEIKNGFKDAKSKTDSESDLNVFFSIPSEDIKWNWRIPVLFMPIISSFILALSLVVLKKKKITILSFFSEVEQHLKENNLKKELPYFENLSEKELRQLYVDWIDEYLGGRYFKTLAGLYIAYPNVKTSKLYGSVCGLTSLLLEGSMPPSSVPFYVNLLLEDYIDRFNAKLEHKKEEKINWEDLTVYSPLFQENENEYYKYLYTFLSDSINALLQMIVTNVEEHHKKDSPYELAVDNYDDFRKRVDEYLDHCNIACVEDDLKSLFKAIRVHPDLKNYILQYSTDRENHRINEICEILGKYQEKTKERFKRIIRHMEWSSSDCPANYKTITKECNNVETLETDIKKLKSDFKKELDKIIDTPSNIFGMNIDLLEDIQYSSTMFRGKDILRIFTVVSKIHPSITQQDVTFLGEDLKLDWLPSSVIVDFLRQLKIPNE